MKIKDVIELKEHKVGTLFVFKYKLRYFNNILRIC